MQNLQKGWAMHGCYVVKELNRHEWKSKWKSPTAFGHLQLSLHWYAGSGSDERKETETEMNQVDESDEGDERLSSSHLQACGTTVPPALLTGSCVFTHKTGLVSCETGFKNSIY